MEGVKALRIHAEGERNRAVIETLPRERIGAGEVLVRVAWSSVNYKDALAATGRGKVVTRFPVVGGIDLSGRVVESASPRFQPGDAVVVTGHQLGTGHDGGYAEYARVPAEWVVALPDGLSTYEAMAIGTAGFTVGLCVERLQANGQQPAHGPLAVTGATGGVGSFAVDILSGLGYDVTAVTGKPEEAEYLRALGAAEVLPRSGLEAGGGGLARARWGGAIDNVGGEVLAGLLRSTRPWGNVVAVGLAGGAALETSVMPFILRGVSLLGVTASGCPSGLRDRTWARLAGDLRPRATERIVARVVELEDLPAVFDQLLAGGLRGRTVVRVGGGE